MRSDYIILDGQIVSFDDIPEPYRKILKDDLVSTMRDRIKTFKEIVGKKTIEFWYGVDNFDDR